jgi:putative endonuclease
MDRRASGDLAENSVCAFLESQGFEIVTRNFLRRVGEIDIVARAGDLLVIAEVRKRESDRYGGAAASIGPAKQRRIIMTTGLLLQQFPGLRNCRIRFDVLTMKGGHIEWLKQAFDA